MKKRIFSLAFAIILCLTLLPSGAFARKTDIFTALPEVFDFDALRFDAGCLSDMESICANTRAMLTQSGKEEQLCAAYDQITALQTEIETQLALITILYYQNPAEHAADFASMSSGSNVAMQTALSTLQSMLTNANYAQRLVSHAGDSEAAAILQKRAPTAAQLEMLNAETELEMQYQNAAAAEQSCTHNGKIWTLASAADALMAGAISYESYLEIARGVYRERNAVLGGIYLEMVALRNRFAASCNYGDYAQYAYPAVYGRDYTLSDAAVFRSAVKTHLVPIAETMHKAFDLGCFYDADTFDGLSEAELLDAIEPYLDEITTEYLEAFEYMRACNLIDAEYSDSKLPVSFTTTLPAYGVPYILCCRNGGNADFSTAVHEFGHFCAFCFGAGSACYDTLEVHSQGLEALFLQFSDELYGADAQAQLGYELYTLLLTVLQGCVYDELQEYAYTTPGLTLDMLNRKSAALLSEYGLRAFGADDSDYTWVEIPHTFESPMYYISYATSAMVALDIYLDGHVEGFDAAVSEYLTFVFNSTIISGFRTLLNCSDLDDPFADNTVARFAQQFEAYLDEQIYRIPYTDVGDCWAKSDVTLLYLMQVMNGTSATEFTPDGNMTRAMAVTVLHRMLGRPEGGADAASVFQDVAENTWYTDAVGWAVTAGVTNGTSATTFSPDALVTCQEFAVMLYRVLLGFNHDYTDAPAPDGAAEWAGDAIIWSRDYAIFESADGNIMPTDLLSRAELAAALVNVFSTF